MVVPTVLAITARLSCLRSSRSGDKVVTLTAAPITPPLSFLPSRTSPSKPCTMPASVLLVSDHGGLSFTIWQPQQSDPYLPVASVGFRARQAPLILVIV